MKISNEYKLHIKIHLERASLAQTGRALGVLFREQLTPQQIICTTERANDTDVSKKAETVIEKLLGRPSPWGKFVDRALLETHTISFDDEKVYQLAEGWDSGGIAESIVVVPHIFYMALIKCFMRDLELRAPEILRQVCIFFDYAELEEAHDIVRQSFFGERDEVLKYARKVGASFIDSGHRLLLENLISLACYMIPANYLVFMDDDFFINNTTSIDKLLDPLIRGYLLSGMHEKGRDRIHTCFFALRPECLRDELLMFDNGENLYSNKSISTGSITYKALSNRDKGVFVLGDYWEGDDNLGRHLGHCTTELWNDLPQILRRLFRPEMLPKNDGEIELDVSILLEALALLFEVRHHECDYAPVDNDLRQNAVNDFATYFGRIYNNYHWLLHNYSSR